MLYTTEWLPQGQRLLNLLQILIKSHVTTARQSVIHSVSQFFTRSVLHSVEFHLMLVSRFYPMHWALMPVIPGVPSVTTVQVC
jgi:hypothetical protein